MEKKHMKCLVWKVLWLLGAISLVLAWMAGPNGAALTLPAPMWFWSALVLGVLAISIKLDCHACGMCGMGGGGMCDKGMCNK